MSPKTHSGSQRRPPHLHVAHRCFRRIRSGLGNTYTYRSYLKLHFRKTPTVPRSRSSKTRKLNDKIQQTQQRPSLSVDNTNCLLRYPPPPHRRARHPLRPRPAWASDRALPATKRASAPGTPPSFTSARYSQPSCEPQTNRGAVDPLSGESRAHRPLPPSALHAPSKVRR